MEDCTELVGKSERSPEAMAGAETLGRSCGGKGCGRCTNPSFLEGVAQGTNRPLPSGRPKKECAPTGASEVLFSVGTEPALNEERPSGAADGSLNIYRNTQGLRFSKKGVLERELKSSFQLEYTNQPFG